MSGCMWIALAILVVSVVKGAIVIPSAPVIDGSNINAISDTSLALNWTATPTYPINYLEISEPATQNNVTTIYYGSNTSATVTGLQTLTVYRFRIVASNGISNTTYSSATVASTSGTIVSIAGSYDHIGYSDGASYNARFSLPRSMDLDITTGNLYVCDSTNNKVRVITSSGYVYTIPTPYVLSGCYGIIVTAGSVIVANQYGRNIVKINLTTLAITVLVNSSSPITQAPVGSSSTLSSTVAPGGSSSTLSSTVAPGGSPIPLSTTVAPGGSPSPLSTTVAPGGSPSPLSTSVAPGGSPSPLSPTAAPGGSPSPLSPTAAPGGSPNPLSKTVATRGSTSPLSPTGLWLDKLTGNMIFSEFDNQAIRTANTTGPASSNDVQTLCYGGHAGAWGLVTDPFGNVVVGYSAMLINCTRSGGAVPAILAGSSTSGYQDGTSALFNNAISGVSFDVPSNSIYIVDYGNKLIRRFLVPRDGDPGYTMTVAGQRSSTTFSPGVGSNSSFFNCAEIFSHPLYPKFIYISDDSGIRMMYGDAPPPIQISNRIGSIAIITTVLTQVPVAAISNFTLTLSQGPNFVATIVHNNEDGAFFFCNLQSNTAYSISAFASNKYGHSPVVQTTVVTADGTTTGSGIGSTQSGGSSYFSGFYQKNTGGGKGSVNPADFQL